MSETLTKTRTEDMIDAAEDFMQSARGVSLDGDFASAQVAERVVSVREQARDLLCLRPVPRLKGLYEPLGKDNADQYDTIAATLPGYMVLVPSTLVDRGASHFYPAVISEDGLKDKVLRLHVLRKPYRRHLGYGTAMVLSAAGQAETRGVGEHRSGLSDGIEAEHFATLLTVGDDPTLQAGWRAGQHINHAWRQQPDSSVTSQVSQRLLGEEVPQSTITITKSQVQAGAARLFWHEGMCDEQGLPEAATYENALIIIQGLAFVALQQNDRRNADGRRALDVVKELVDD